jgi:Uncharacterized conserved protein
MSSTKDREIEITRVFNAPRSLVFTVWTDPKHIIHWWGPNGFTNTIYEMDVRPGGVWRFMMHGPDGVDYPNKIVFKKVVKPEYLEYSHGSDDEDHPGNFEVTVHFREKGKQTEITMRMVFRSKDERDIVIEKYGALEGNTQTMNKLEEYLKRFDEL